MPEEDDVAQRLVRVGGSQITVTHEKAMLLQAALRAAIDAYAAHGGQSLNGLLGSLLGNLIDREGVAAVRLLIEKVFSIYEANEEFVRKMNAGEDAVLKIPGDG